MGDGHIAAAEHGIGFETSQVVLCRHLGRGAFGEVLLAKAIPFCSTLPPRLVALKRASVAEISEKGTDQALAEAKLLQSLGEEHPGILRCFDFRLLSGSSAVLELLLEFAPFGDLHARISAHKHSQLAGADADSDVTLVGLPEVEAASYICDIADGLTYMHSKRPKVLHRDVKPANVVLFPSVNEVGEGRPGRGTLPRAKLADFGIAKILESECSLAGAATVVGTPHYFSPELCRGEPYDERADAWALGCILYEMVCLHRPFHKVENNVAALAVRISEGAYDYNALTKRSKQVNGAILLTTNSLLTWDPIRRYRAADVRQALHWLIASESVAAYEAAAGASCCWWANHEVATVETEEADETLGFDVGDDDIGDGDDGWSGAQEFCPDAPPTQLPATQLPAVQLPGTQLPGTQLPEVTPRTAPAAPPQDSNPPTLMPGDAEAAAAARHLVEDRTQTLDPTTLQGHVKAGDGLLQTQYLDAGSFAGLERQQQAQASRLAWGGDQSQAASLDATMPSATPKRDAGEHEQGAKDQEQAPVHPTPKRAFMRPIHRGMAQRKPFEDTTQRRRHSRAAGERVLETPMVFYFPKADAGGEVNASTVEATVSAAGCPRPMPASMPHPHQTGSKEGSEWVEVQLPREQAAAGAGSDGGIFSLTSPE